MPEQLPIPVAKLPERIVENIHPLPEPDAYGAMVPDIDSRNRYEQFLVDRMDHEDGEEQDQRSRIAAQPARSRRGRDVGRLCAFIRRFGRAHASRSKQPRRRLMVAVGLCHDADRPGAVRMELSSPLSSGGADPDADAGHSGIDRMSKPWRANNWHVHVDSSRGPSGVPT